MSASDFTVEKQCSLFYLYDLDMMSTVEELEDVHSISLFSSQELRVLAEENTAMMHV